jgi:HK97 family phage major capsid protein|nr:MAG TPA: major capsid protein [Caudoviricetes sp.]
MNREQYLQLRNGLYNEAEALINEGKIEDANAKMEEIKELDNKFEEGSKATANLNALKDNAKVTNLENNSKNIIGGTVLANTSNAIEEDLTNSVEYRKAFMNYVSRGVEMPREFMNANENTKTTDASVMIPTTVLEKIIEKIEATGMILPLVTRTSIKGGVTVPTSTVKPVASWVAEGATSDKQKKQVQGTITFAYYKLRCAVSMSLEMDTMALPVFETTLINNVVEAMTKAIEESIINGTGVGQPKGILKETPNEGQSLEVDTIDYDTLIDAESALPLEYESGAVYCMTKKTFMTYQGMKDSAGQPIARVNYGIGGKPERTLLGRQVILCNYLPSFDAAISQEAFAFLFNFKDYVLNTNLNMTMKRYEDNDTDDQVTKAIMLVDGKVLQKDSLVILKKA